MPTSLNTSLKLTTLPRPPGPTASANERTAWNVRIYRAITEITRSIQNIQGSPANAIATTVPIPPSSGGHDLSPDNPASIEPGSTASPGTSLDGSRQDHVHPFGIAVGDLSMDIHDVLYGDVGSGPVLTVNDGTSDRQYRIKLRWNASAPTPGPGITLTEVF